MTRFDSRGVPAAAYAAGYERLRAQALAARSVCDGDGLAVLAHRGLAAWLHRQAEPREAPALARGSSHCATPMSSAQAVDILLGMARAHLTEAPA